MNTPFDLDTADGRQIVYVRPVAVADLPEEMRAQADGRDHVYAVHSSEGERLALVKDRRMAFLLAREHDMAPISVH